MEWISLLQTLGGIAGGLGIGMFTKSGRRKTKADADARVAEAQKLMIENYEARIKDLHSSIETLNKSEAHYIERISQQNHALDSKTEQIRNLTQKVWDSEQEVNRVQDMLNEANGRITSLTEERDEERRQKDYYKMWHCRRDGCSDGIPPRDRLKGQKFKEPK